MLYYKFTKIKLNDVKEIPKFLIDFSYTYSSAIPRISNLWFDLIYLVVFTNLPRYDQSLSKDSPSVRPIDFIVLG